MNPIFVNAALHSTYNVLNTMAAIDIKPGVPVLKTDDRYQGAVTGIMDMMSAQTQGALAISFSEEVILELAERMLGEKLESVDETALDLTGEIVNMVVGGAKAILSEQGYDFEMSRPNMILGNDIEAKPNYGGQTVTLPFSTAVGDFYVDFTYCDTLELAAA